MNEKLIRDLVDQAKDYEQYLLTAGLAVYVGLLLIKVGLKTYCE